MPRLFVFVAEDEKKRTYAKIVARAATICSICQRRIQSSELFLPLPSSSSRRRSVAFFPRCRLTYLMAATLSSTKFTWPGQSMRLSRYDFPAVLSSTIDTGHDFTDRPRCCSSTRVSVYRTSFVGSNGFTLEEGGEEGGYVLGA